MAFQTGILKYNGEVKEHLRTTAIDDLKPDDVVTYVVPSSASYQGTSNSVHLRSRDSTDYEPDKLAQMSHVHKPRYGSRTSRAHNFLTEVKMGPGLSNLSQAY
jgi:hypothetical protein